MMVALIVEIINVVIWPFVVVLFIVLFSKKIKIILGYLAYRLKTLKVGKFEFTLNDLPRDIKKNERKSLAIADKGTLRNKRLADLRLFLKTLSSQLLAWIYFNKKGNSFSLSSLLNIEHIPVYLGKQTVTNYCVHSLYEKEAIAAEFKRNYFNFKRLGLIYEVDNENVKVGQDKNILKVLDEAMQEIGRIESERGGINKFPNRPLLTKG